MSQRPPLCIGLSLAITWLTGNGWRRPDSCVEAIHASSFYTAIARRAEAACLDFLFRPDTLYLDTRVLARSPGFSSLDPTVLLSAIATATTRIGLVTTAATTFNPPYVVARQLQSLDWISQGRAGWNVVTALDGNGNFGDAPMPPSKARYDKALEFTDVVQRLWRSYPRDALVVDRATGRYADTARVRPIDHRGPYFSVQGPLNLPAHGAGRIPLFQAGASAWGRDFAARVADAVFAAAPDLDACAELRQDLRSRAAAHGRRPDAIRVLPGLSLYLGRTASEARDLYEATHADADQACRLDYLARMLGIDVRQFAPDQPLTRAMLGEPVTTLRSQTHADLLRRLVEREQPTVQELLRRPETGGSAHWRVVGTADDALREILAWADAGAADGFIALPGGSAGSLDLFLDELMPRLVARGRFRREYAGATLAAHLGIPPEN